MTNLAAKGLIGIQAMAQISDAFGESSDVEQYQVRHQAISVSQQHVDLASQGYISANIETWQSLALSADQSHFLFSYGDESSSALMYNLFADLLLGTNVVPQSVRLDFHVLWFELDDSPPYSYIRTRHNSTRTR